MSISTIQIECNGTPVARIALESRLPLTPRELEIVERLAHGMSIRSIAEDLGTVEQTVRNQCVRLRIKLRLTKGVRLGAWLSDKVAAHCKFTYSMQQEQNNLIEP